jgi:hypothetical protein
MMRYIHILAVVALLVGLAEVGYIAQYGPKPVYGVFEGTAITTEGHYFLIEGRAFKSLLVNATLLHGKFVLWGGYLLNGTEVRPRYITSAIVTNKVVVVVGDIRVLEGEVHKLGNFTVVTGNPAKVLVVSGYLYHPK